MDALRVLGAEVKLVPAVPFDDPGNYNHQVHCTWESFIQDSLMWPDLRFRVWDVTIERLSSQEF